MKKRKEPQAAMKRGWPLDWLSGWHLQDARSVESQTIWRSSRIIA